MSGPRLLLIDDEVDLLATLAEELTDEGYDVVTARAGEIAVEKASRKSFDLAITDLKMPGMDGIQTLRALKLIAPRLEVIVATGYATDETRRTCLQLGAFGFLEKPFDLDTMLALIRQAIPRGRRA